MAPGLFSWIKERERNLLSAERAALVMRPPVFSDIMTCEKRIETHERKLRHAVDLDSLSARHFSLSLSVSQSRCLGISVSVSLAVLDMVSRMLV